MSMKSKNQALMEKQDYEVHGNPTGTETRIEIHIMWDICFHVLFCRWGSYLTIHKEEPFTPVSSSVGFIK